MERWNFGKLLLTEALLESTFDICVKVFFPIITPTHSLGTHYSNIPIVREANTLHNRSIESDIEIQMIL